MRTAFPAQELPVRSALTVGVRCVNRTRKHATSVTAYSVLRACPSIQCSTPKLHRQTTGKFENERPPIPHPASQPLKVKRLSATDGPFTRPAHRTIVIHLSWNCFGRGRSELTPSRDAHCLPQIRWNRYRG